MSETAITAAKPDKMPAAAPVESAPPLPRIRREGFFWRGLCVLASLRITVVLFALALVLVFFGTLAQMNAGIWTVVNDYFRSWGIIWIPFQLFVQFGQVFFGVSHEAHWGGSFPFPTGFTIGAVMMVNLLAAHIVRFRFTWKRAGILVLHGGLILLMVSEFITANYAIEGSMTILDGGSSNYVEHREYTELAIINHLNAKEDEIVAVPDRVLRHGGLIHNELLPFDVEVLRFMVNSALADAKGTADNPADRGDGKNVVALPRREVAGTSQEQKINLPSAYVRFCKPGSGESLGTYLVSLELTLVDLPPQTVKVGGKTYEVSLRFKRTYRPYTIHLLKFHHEVYPGTNKPKDFSSYIRLVDPSRGEDREARVWMNHPLRYAGETFYQQSFLDGDIGTVLQVVRNPGWRLPYIACFLVAIGMLFHFGVKLTGFLMKTLPARTAAPPAAPPGRRRPRFTPSPGIDAAVAQRQLVVGGILGFFFVIVVILRLLGTFPSGLVGGGIFAALLIAAVAQGVALFLNPRSSSLPSEKSWLVPWLVPALLTAGVGAYLILMMLTPPEGPDQFQFQQAADLPVLDGGRIKPLDTLARSSLMVLSGKQTFQDDNDKSQPAIKWLLDVMTTRLSEKMKGEPSPSRNYKVFRIENLEVLNLLGLQPRSGFRYSFEELADNLQKVGKESQRVQALKKRGQEPDLYDLKVAELAEHLQLYMSLAMLDPLLVPPPPGADPNDWQSLSIALQMAHAHQQDDPGAEGVFKILLSYAGGNVRQFNKSVADYHQLVDHEFPTQGEMAHLETFFNQFAPFYQCMILYILVFLLAAFSWMLWREPLRRAAFWLLVLTFLVHSWALVVRMYLQGRPPVTNLYSSAVFIGWAGVLLGLGLELIFRVGIGAAVSALLGFATVFISHHLAQSGDTMEMMQAVLDTNFWLATHVTCVTLGYTATLLAGSLALLYLFVRGIARLVDPRLASLQIDVGGQRMDLFRILSQMLYGVICFAMLFSFVGTVLGGIWADQSWGRFWGWDPKENGALLIVVWNALILHARWGGLVKSPGVARLAIIGNMITFWSWFGTNQLGVGLHAYGFNDTLVLWCRYLWISQLVILALEGLTLIDWKRWFGSAQPTQL
jgi:ABC-type transport system involved in cytochrome c biogenesis permease subunit